MAGYMRLDMDAPRSTIGSWLSYKNVTMFSCTVGFIMGLYIIGMMVWSLYSRGLAADRRNRLARLQQARRARSNVSALGKRAQAGSRFKPAAQRRLR